MEPDVLMLLCIAGVFSVATGLHCYNCTGWKNDNAQDTCLGNMQDSLPTSFTCPTPAAGKVAKCFTYMTETVPAGPLSTFVSRGCEATDPDTADGCTTSYMSSETRTSIDQYCYCSSDNCNQQTFASPTPTPGGLQCYRCDAMYMPNDEANVCIDSVTNAMPLVTCPPPPEGQVAACFFTRTESVAPGLDPSTSASRGCAVRDPTTARDSCITEYINTDLTSKNDTCYCSSANCNGKSVREMSAANQGSEGLKCYTCRGETEGPANVCVDADVNSMMSQTCAVPPAGQVVKCLRSYHESALLGTTKHVTRGCVFVPADTTDGCTEKASTGGFGDGPVFECYCSTDNCNIQTAPEGLQCYRCLGLNQNNEADDCVDSVTSAMPLVTCPTAPEGQVAACVLTRAEDVFRGQPTTYVSRGCSVRDPTTATDGCTTEYVNSANSASKNDTCYCSSASCNGKTVREMSAANQGSEGLECYTCIGITDGSANVCVDADVNSMMSQTCAVPPAGQVAKCLHSYQKLDILPSAQRVTRGCVFVPAKATDGCTEKASPDGLGRVSECYCSADNCNTQAAQQGTSGGSSNSISPTAEISAGVIYFCLVQIFVISLSKLQV